jgi:hypothetical protein
VSFHSTVELNEATLGSSDIDRELRRPVKCDQRDSESHSVAPELAMMQCAGLLGVWTVLSGLTVAMNTAKHSATMANVTKLKTCFITLPIHLHLAPIFSICSSHATQGNAGNVAFIFLTRVPRARRLAELEDGASESRLRQKSHCR